MHLSFVLCILFELFFFSIAHSLESRINDGIDVYITVSALFFKNQKEKEEKEIQYQLYFFFLFFKREKENSVENY
jgi:hypothetical protein